MSEKLLLNFVTTFQRQTIEISGNVFLTIIASNILVIKLNKKRNETNLKISGSLVELIMNSFFFRNLLSRALEFYGQLGHICSFEQLFIYVFFYCFGAWYSAPAVSTHSDNHN